MTYKDIYFKRLNRYGEDFQSRIQNQREREFETFLLKSIYRVDFEYNGNLIPASFEKYKQDETETLHYLLTKVDVNIPNGTILMIKNKDDIEKPWMVYYLENIKASGYNRYIMLKMSHYLTWTDRAGKIQNSWAYMYGQQDNMLRDEIRSRSRMDTIYGENLKLNFFIMPRNEFLKQDDYFIVGEKPFQEQYRVTGYDIQSSEGIEYVSVDPIHEFDLSPAPQKTESDKAEDFYWLQGGES